MSRLKRTGALIAIVAIAEIFALGCQSTENPEANRTTANAVDRLQGLVIIFLRSRGAVKDEVSLRKGFETLDDDVKQRLHLKSVDELFVSPRDQQPFIINYQAKPGTPGMSSDIFACEAEGKEGQRLAAFTSLDVREATEEELKSLPPR